MKRLIFTFMLMLQLVAFAQEKHRVYCEIMGSQKGLFSRKVTVTIDFGQKVSFWKASSDSKIVDENGKDIVFNSMVDAMNFMGRCGWNFQQAYVVTVGDSNVYHWLLYKDVIDDSEITNGFKVKADFSKNTSTYSLTYLKRKVGGKWSIEHEVTKKLAHEEINTLIEEYRAKSDDKYEYDVQVRKN